MRGKTLARGLAIIAAACPAIAHHSFDGAFDRNKTVKLTGTVAAFAFTEPHVYFTFDVTGADGKVRQWHVETTSARGLAAHGWTPQSLKAGEKLTVEGRPAWEGKAYVRLSSMAHADGSALGLWVPEGPTPRPAG